MVPLISLPMTYWLYTNKQMFDNKIDPIKTLNETVRSHHLIGEVRWKTMSDSESALILIWIFCLSYVVGSELLKKVLPRFSIRF
jgi:hypothetical protein